VSRKRTVLVTGFGPFPGAPFNPSGPLVRELARRRNPDLRDVQIIPHVFTTSYDSVDRELPALIAQHRPDILLMFGLANSSGHVRIETQARNVLSALPDASGRIPASSAIQPGAPATQPVCADSDALLRAARRGRIAVRLSHDAGGYLCNYLYWRALDKAARPDGPALVAFIHIPDTRRKPLRRGQRRRVTRGDLLGSATAILKSLVSPMARPVAH
jgi:pyroglutamyl-peptidase